MQATHWELHKHRMKSDIIPRFVQFTDNMGNSETSALRGPVTGLIMRLKMEINSKDVCMCDCENFKVQS